MAQGSFLLPTCSVATREAFSLVSGPPPRGHGNGSGPQHTSARLWLNKQALREHLLCAKHSSG